MPPVVSALVIFLLCRGTGAIIPAKLAPIVPQYTVLGGQGIAPNVMVTVVLRFIAVIRANVKLPCKSVVACRS